MNVTETPPSASSLPAGRGESVISLVAPPHFHHGLLVSMIAGVVPLGGIGPTLPFESRPLTPRGTMSEVLSLLWVNTTPCKVRDERVPKRMEVEYPPRFIPVGEEVGLLSSGSLGLIHPRIVDPC